jgi:uncharacterized metal-binding protein
MATGKTHEKVAIVVSGATAFSYLFLPVDMATALLVGTINGGVVTPDIDVDGTTREERRLENIPLIGPFVRYAFQVFWYPYALAFNHRGFSHIPILGTLSRAIYQTLGISFILYVFTEATGAIIPRLWNVDWIYTLTYLIGWCIQDMFHILFDHKRVLYSVTTATVTALATFIWWTIV